MKKLLAHHGVLFHAGSILGYYPKQFLALRPIFINRCMKRVTLVFSPKPRNGRELGQLIEAIAERIPVKGGKTVDEIEVSVDDMVRVNKLLRMHGYEVVDKRIHEAAKRPLVGALEKLNEKYDINEGMFTGTDDRPKKVSTPPSLHKRKVMNFINGKVRAARRARMKTRVQHKRDKLDGRIEALDDVIRYLKKK